MEQKYHHGDHVQVAKDLGDSMSHFTSDCEAIIDYSYADKYGGNNIDSYGIHIKGSGTSAWYYEHQLTLIEADRGDLLKKWEKERQEESELKSDLDWIFSHAEEVIELPHGASVGALAKCFGLTNLWGSHGEGFVYYQNAMTTLALAKPFLEKNDKEGWLLFCKEIKVDDDATKE